MTHDITQADMHRPTPAFRDFLEEQVSRTFRRDRSLRRFRLAAVILVSVALGTTGGLASAQIRESTQRDSLLDAARADVTLVQVRLQLARAQLDEARRALSVGAALPESAAAAELQVREMEAQIARAAMNMDEIKMTAQAPRDELNAPVVDGRDFVKERIQIRLMLAQQQMQAAEVTRAAADRRVRAGVASEVSNLDADVGLARARRELAMLAERLALRKEFLDKGTPIEELSRRLDQAQVRQDIDVARQSLNLAQERVSILEKRRAVGASGELEVLKAQVEMKERQIELQQLAKRLRDIGR